MAIEDFSFPAITDSSSDLIDSPPLWCLSPAASPGRSCHVEAASEDSREEVGYKGCFPAEPSKYSKRKSSLSGLEEVAAKLEIRRGCQDDEEEEEEDKMDMLWEDFNTEELYTRSDGERLESDVVSMGCVEALRLPRTSGGAIFALRKPSFVVFMKILKRLFLLQNSHLSVRDQHPYCPVKNHSTNRAVKINHAF